MLRSELTGLLSVDALEEGFEEGEELNTSRESNLPMRIDNDPPDLPEEDQGSIFESTQGSDASPASHETSPSDILMFTHPKSTPSKEDQILDTVHNIAHSAEFWNRWTVMPDHLPANEDHTTRDLIKQRNSVLNKLNPRCTDETILKYFTPSKPSFQDAKRKDPVKLLDVLNQTTAEEMDTS